MGFKKRSIKVCHKWTCRKESNPSIIWKNTIFMILKWKTAKFHAKNKNPLYFFLVAKLSTQFNKQKILESSRPCAFQPRCGQRGMDEVRPGPSSTSFNREPLARGYFWCCVTWDGRSARFLWWKFAVREWPLARSTQPEQQTVDLQGHLQVLQVDRVDWRRILARNVLWVETVGILFSKLKPKKCR